MAGLVLTTVALGPAGLIFGSLVGLLGWATGVLHERYANGERDSLP